MIVRLVHGATFLLPKLPRVIGLDEWAWRRGRRFGTIVCDLERHHVLDLLPERSAATVAQWLRAHPSVEVVRRDRSGLYAEGIRQGAPQAIQVVDRFHLVQNLGGALERFFLRRRRDLDTLGGFPPSIVGAHAHACQAQPGASHLLGPPLPRDSAVACPTARDCRHRAAGPGQSPDRLSVSRHAPAARAATVTAPRTAPDYAVYPVSATASVSRHAPAARAATVTAPRTAPHYAVYPVSATAMERRLSQCPTTLAGARGPGAPTGAAESTFCGIAFSCHVPGWQHSRRWGATWLQVVLARTHWRIILEDH